MSANAYGGEPNPFEDEAPGMQPAGFRESQYGDNTYPAYDAHDKYAPAPVDAPAAPASSSQPQPPTGMRMQALPNWPVCKPFLYHNIKAEIDVQHQSLVRQLYSSWWLTFAALVMNMAGTMCLLIAGINGQDFGLSIMYFFVITVLSFFLWYFPIYKAFRNNSSFYFWVYFFFGGWHIAFCLYCWLGFETTGGAGIINAVLLFNNDKQAEGIVCIVSMLFWFITAATCGALYFRVYRHYRQKGHSFADARNEAVSTAAKSDAVRSAGAAVGSAAVSSYARQYDEV